MGATHDQLLDRLDRVTDRLDRLVDRLDRVIDRQDQHTRTLKEIKTMTAANGQGQEALLDALGQLDAALTDGLTSVAGTVNDLNAQIASLTSLSEADREALQRAASNVTNQVSRVNEAFSNFRSKDETPTDPSPVPSPEPAPEPGDGERPTPGPVGPGDESGFQFGS